MAPPYTRHRGPSPHYTEVTLQTKYLKCNFLGKMFTHKTDPTRLQKFLRTSAYYQLNGVTTTPPLILNHTVSPLFYLSALEVPVP